ncbi:MAG: hypothetical protein ACYS8X_10070 [Planctomycetota bacterium]|jgi:hypothetical protein
MKPWLILAVICGVLPLVAGLIVLSTYCFVDSEELAAFGVVIIVIGFGLFLLGLLGLSLYVWSARRAGRKGGDYGWPAALALVVLLANFPAAFLSLVAGAKIDGARYRVYVINTASKPIQMCHLVGGGVDIDLKTIPAKSQVTQWFFVRRDSQLMLTGQFEGHRIEQAVDRTLRRWEGEELYITVEDDGDVIAEQYSSFD